MLWTKTSAVSTSRSNAACATGRFKSSTTLFLLRLMLRKLGPHPGVARRPQRADRVAARHLDFDHVGTHVAEDLGRHRPQYRRRQIYDADACERSGHAQRLHAVFSLLNREFTGENRTGARFVVEIICIIRDLCPGWDAARTLQQGAFDN